MDAPSLVAETQAAKAQVRVEQMQTSVKGQQLYDGDSSDKSTICPACGKPSGSTKFCQNCGAPLGFKVCPKCQHQNPPTVSFCGECGDEARLIGTRVRVLLLRGDLPAQHGLRLLHLGTEQVSRLRMRVRTVGLGTGIRRARFRPLILGCWGR